MSFTLTIGLQGLGQAIANLREINRKAARKVLPKALRAGGKVLVKAAKSEAPVETGVLRRSMMTRVKSYMQGQRQVAVIGPRRQKYGNGRNPANYAHLVEFGHRVSRRGKLLRLVRSKRGIRFINQGRTAFSSQGKMIGKAAGNPFMKRAASTADSQAVAAFAVTAAAELALNLPRV